MQTTKVDAEYPDHKLTGAVFEVYVDVDGDQAYRAETDRFIGEMSEVETGVYRMDGLQYNGYFLHEKTSPEGFLKDDNYYYFEIREDGETVTVENEADVGFVNQPITGKLELTKKDISDGKLLPGVGSVSGMSRAKLLPKAIRTKMVSLNLHSVTENTPIRNSILWTTTSPMKRSIPLKSGKTVKSSKRK